MIKDADVKILMRHCVIFVLSLTLLSCQGNTQSTQIQETITSPTQTQSVAIPETLIPATGTPRIITPAVITADINFVPELNGSLFVGSSYSGVYIELNFDNDLAFRYQLPEGCQLLANGQKAVCEVSAFSDISEIYVYDVQTGQRDFAEKRDVGMWYLTSSEHLLTYTHAGREGIGISISAYDFRDNTSLNIGTFDNKERKLAIPQLSNSAKSMIGLNYMGLSWDYDDEWYVMNAGAMEAELINVPANIAADNSIEWSPNDAMVALVGFYRDDENPHVGALRCEKEVLIYDPIAKIVESRVKVPEKRCYTSIDFYPNNIWSPDSSKLALVLDQQDICIIHVSESRPVCFLISNYYKTDNFVTSLTWSPDSNYVAFIVDRNHVQVYSIEDNKTYIIADTDELSSLPIGKNLVWGP